MGRDAAQPKVISAKTQTQAMIKRGANDNRADIGPTLEGFKISTLPPDSGR